METYLRYSIFVHSKQYPFKAPANVQESAQKTYMRCKKYSINESTNLVLVPVKSPEYDLVKKFIADYPDYASQLIIYEHKYTREELEAAEYLLLQSSSIILLKDDINLFSRCCNKKTLMGEQLGSFRIGKNDFKNKVISGSDMYRYLSSIETREKLEEMGATNFKYIPVYSAKNPDLAAYQIEAEELLPPLEPYNHWGIHKKCEGCGKVISYPIHKFPQPLTLPKSYLELLKDFNATSEVFSELAARYYIISKRVHNLFLSLGAKKLICEPVVFSD